jgi:hypothetical protein
MHAVRSILACALLLVASAASAGEECGNIGGFAQHLSHARGVFVGDLHGTVESPAFVDALVCNLARSGRRVLLALEYPESEQHFLEEFLRTCTDGREPPLLSSPFWTRPTQDGRSSQAVLDLLYSIRRQLRAGAHIRVVAFDSPPPGDSGGAAAFDARDESMALRLRELISKAAAGEIPVIFTGNVHARKLQGLQALNAPPGMENAEPLGYRLRDLGFLYLKLGYRGGSAWTCAASCGVLELGEPGAAVSSYAIVRSADPAYDLACMLGPLTASPPAVAVK